VNIARLGALALLAAVAAPIVSLAQGYGAPPAPAGGPAMAPRDHGDMRQEMEAHEQARIQAMHEVLRIRPDQDGAFQAFVAAMHPQPPADGWRHEEPGGGHAAMARMTTPERLDRMAQLMDARESRRRAEFQRRATATKALYAALSPEQRQIMDALPALEGHGGHGWSKDDDMGHGRNGGMSPMGPPPPPPGA
jgi:protein CpxP